MQNHANCVRSNTPRPRGGSSAPQQPGRRVFPSRPGPPLFFSVFPRPRLSSFRLLAEHRASAGVKNVSTIACRGARSFIFAEGWNTRLGGAAAPGTKGMKLRPPYLRLCRVGREKTLGNRCRPRNPFRVLGCASSRMGSWVTRFELLGL